MSVKKIIIVNPGLLYPIIGMYQVRVINQIKSLSKTHEVDLLFLWEKKKGKEDTVRELEKYCNKVIPLRTVTQTLAFRIVRKLFLKKLFSKINYPFDYYTFSNSISGRQISKKINRRNYDIIITHYWQSAGFLRFIKSPMIKCIDTHYAVEENIELYRGGKYDHFAEKNYGRLLRTELQLQNRQFSNSDLLIVNSPVQKQLISKTFADKNILVITNGQDLDYFFDYKMNSNEIIEKSILFYGALSSQFNSLALKRILDNIFPELKKRVKDLKLIILGSNPPDWLNEYVNSNDIIITGYVKDIRPVLSKSYISLLPLDSGSGFRGRTIELMAMGVPVIGTHNALASIDMEHGKHGYILDEDNEIISAAMDLLKDRRKRDQISRNERELVKAKYTLEATFGKLSEFLTNIEMANTKIKILLSGDVVPVEQNEKKPDQSLPGEIVENIS